MPELQRYPNRTARPTVTTDTICQHHQTRLNIALQILVFTKKNRANAGSPRTAFLITTANPTSQNCTK